jgi:hypothetical protein
MCSLLMEDLPLLLRIEAARRHYQRASGKLPTRLVLTADDLDELSVWRLANPRHPAYMNVPMSNEPEILGMRYTVDAYASMLRVYFQES